MRKNLAVVIACAIAGSFLGGASSVKAQSSAPQPLPAEPPPLEAPPATPAPGSTTKTVTTTTTTVTTTQTQGEAALDQPNFDSFHQQLSPYGQWIQINGEWVWHPAVPPTWRPYYDGGHWAYTDAGWYWQSDYPWGDIAFHYGRWGYSAGVGWTWTPAYEFAPAWVYWRHSEGYVGWAPLPPGTVFVGGAWHYHGAAVAVTFDFGLTPAYFTFVGCDHFWEHDYRHYIVPRDRVTVIYRTSVVVNNYHVDARGHYVNEGLGRERMEAMTHHEVKVVAAHDLHVEEHHDHVVQREADIKVVQDGGKVEADHKMEPKQMESKQMESKQTESNHQDVMTHDSNSRNNGPNQVQSPKFAQNEKGKKKKNNSNNSNN